MNYLNSNKVLKAIKEAERSTLVRARGQAIKWSSGKWSSKKLAKFGHPYSARRKPLFYPYDDPAKINIQSGLFIISWEIVDGTVEGNNIISKLTNTAPYSGKLEKGIKGRTIPRPLLQRLAPTVDYWRVKKISIGIARALGN